jgi:outer membrane receptor protein involved in Fe transport
MFKLNTKIMLALGSSSIASLSYMPASSVSAAEMAASVSAEEMAAIEKIVVTARKRGAELLQDTPISIRALTKDTLTDAGIENFEDWVRLVPGITFKDLGPGEKTIVTRGLVSTGSATTAVYFDETNITAFNDGEGGGRNVDIKLFDIERIDVLRGPQGTIYGASALGGVVRIESAKPQLDEFSAGFELGLSDTSSGGSNSQYNGFADIPIIQDKLGVRIAAWKVENSGYIDNIRLGNDDINDEDTTGFRITALWQATDDLRLTASAMHQDQDIGDGARFNNKGDFALNFPGEAPFTIDGDLQNSDFTVNNRTDKPRIYSITADYSFDLGNIVATTNLYDREILFNFDSTPILVFFGVPVKAVSSFPEERKIWSNEIRYNSNFDGPLQVLTGIFYQEETIDSSSRVLTVGSDGRINESSPSILYVEREREFNEVAVFGEIAYDITQAWSVSVGGRYAEFDFVTDENALVPFFGAPTGPEETKSGDDNTFISRFNTSYAISDDHMIFATAAEGFRRGGLNLNAFGSLFDIPETFGSDTLWNYELGAKTSWFDNKLTVNATIYTIDWSDIQLETVSELGGVEYFSNAGSAQIDGLELEIFARPIEGLDITATLNWTNARLTEDAPFPGTGRDGDNLNNVPDWGGSISAQYRWPLFEDVYAFARADAEFSDGANTSVAGDRDPFNVALESYEILNLRAGIENDNWRLDIYADNVFDERSQNDAINEVTNILAYFSARPRSVGVKLGSRF